MVFYVTLKILFEVFSNLLNQMCSVGTINIVVVARIYKVIQEFAVVDGVLNKAQAVLPYHSGVGGAMDNQ